MSEYDVTLLESEMIPRGDVVVLEQQFEIVAPVGELGVPNKTKVRDIIEREMGVDLPGSIVIDEYEGSMGPESTASCFVTHYTSVAKPDTSSLPSYYGTSPIETIAIDKMKEGLIDKSKNHIEVELTGTAMTGWEPNKRETDCPHCGESFEEGKGVEGDDGTELCSLSCVNEYCG